MCLREMKYSLRSLLDSKYFCGEVGRFGVIKLRSNYGTLLTLEYHNTTLLLIFVWLASNFTFGSASIVLLVSRRIPQTLMMLD